MCWCCFHAVYYKRFSALTCVAPCWSSSINPGQVALQSVTFPTTLFQCWITKPQECLLFPPFLNLQNPERFPTRGTLYRQKIGQMRMGGDYFGVVVLGLLLFFYIVPSSRHVPSTCLLRLIRRRTSVDAALSHGMVWFAAALAPANPKSTPPYPGPFARCGDGFVEVGACSGEGRGPP